jgi:hypothetical protein
MLSLVHNSHAGNAEVITSPFSVSILVESFKSSEHKPNIYKAICTTIGGIITTYKHNIKNFCGIGFPAVLHKVLVTGDLNPDVILSTISLIYSFAVNEELVKEFRTEGLDKILLQYKTNNENVNIKKCASLAFKKISGPSGASTPLENQTSQKSKNSASIPAKQPDTTKLPASTVNSVEDKKEIKPVSEVKSTEVKQEVKSESNEIAVDANKGNKANNAAEPSNTRKLDIDANQVAEQANDGSVTPPKKVEKKKVTKKASSKSLLDGADTSAGPSTSTSAADRENIKNVSSSENNPSATISTTDNASNAPTEPPTKIGESKEKIFDGKTEPPTKSGESKEKIFDGKTEPPTKSGESKEKIFDVKTEPPTKSGESKEKIFDGKTEPPTKSGESKEKIFDGKTEPPTKSGESKEKIDDGKEDMVSKVSSKAILENTVNETSIGKDDTLAPGTLTPVKKVQKARGTVIGSNSGVPPTAVLSESTLLAVDQKSSETTINGASITTTGPVDSTPGEIVKSENTAEDSKLAKKMKKARGTIAAVNPNVSLIEQSRPADRPRTETMGSELDGIFGDIEESADVKKAREEAEMKSKQQTTHDTLINSFKTGGNAVKAEIKSGKIGMAANIRLVALLDIVETTQDEEIMAECIKTAIDLNNSSLAEKYSSRLLSDYSSNATSSFINISEEKTSLIVQLLSNFNNNTIVQNGSLLLFQNVFMKKSKFGDSPQLLIDAEKGVLSCLSQCVGQYPDIMSKCLVFLEDDCNKHLDNKIRLGTLRMINIIKLHLTENNFDFMLANVKLYEKLLKCIIISCTSCTANQDLLVSEDVLPNIISYFHKFAKLKDERFTASTIRCIVSIIGNHKGCQDILGQKRFSSIYFDILGQCKHLEKVMKAMGMFFLGIYAKRSDLHEELRNSGVANAVVIMLDGYIQQGDVGKEIIAMIIRFLSTVKSLQPELQTNNIPQILVQIVKSVPPLPATALKNLTSAAQNVGITL